MAQVLSAKLPARQAACDVLLALVPQQLARFEADGATEIAYQPAGPDIPRELEAFAKAALG